MIISSAVATRIRELIKEKNLTLYRFERKAGMAHDTLKSIMKEKAKGVNLKTCVILAKGFDMEVWEFLNSELFKFENLEID